MKSLPKVLALLLPVLAVVGCETNQVQAERNTKRGAEAARTGNTEPTPQVRQAPLFGAWNSGGESSRKSLTMRGNNDAFGDAQGGKEGKESDRDDSRGFLFGGRSGSTIQSGNAYFHSDGSATIQRGNRFYNTDGSSAVRSGNTLFRSDGSTSTRSGNTYYNSDGSRTTQSGNAFFNSDGTATIRKGNSYYNTGGD